VLRGSEGELVCELSRKDLVALCAHVQQHYFTFDSLNDQGSGIDNLQLKVSQRGSFKVFSLTQETPGDVYLRFGGKVAGNLASKCHLHVALRNTYQVIRNPASSLAALGSLIGSLSFGLFCVFAPWSLLLAIARSNSYIIYQQLNQQINNQCVSRSWPQGFQGRRSPSTTCCPWASAMESHCTWMVLVRPTSIARI
jgi:hypothetical protein